MITFVKKLDDVVKNVPLEKIMVETDSPYLSPKPYRGKINEPSYVIHVVEKIAKLKEITMEKVAKSTTKTALNLFKKLNSNS
jgi:TatD DNase family protein